MGQHCNNRRCNGRRKGVLTSEEIKVEVAGIGDPVYAELITFSPEGIATASKKLNL